MNNSESREYIVHRFDTVKIDKHRLITQKSNQMNIPLSSAHHIHIDTIHSSYSNLVHIFHCSNKDWMRIHSPLIRNEHHRKVECIDKNNYSKRSNKYHYFDMDYSNMDLFQFHNGYLYQSSSCIFWS